MRKAEYHALLENWQQVVFVLIFLAIAAGILNLVIYFLKFSLKKTVKKKYDLASEKELRVLSWSNLLISISLFCVVNILENDTVKLNIVWFFVRMFVGVATGILFGYIISLVIKYYYPSKLEKRLKKLRYTPRINPETGAKMKLLDEESEDAYLDEEMQAEESTFSVDYDVWIDPDTGFTIIEKYKSYLNALECDRCGLQSLKLEKEEIVKKSSEEEDGEIIKHYKCSYCSRIKRKTVVLSHKIKQDAQIEQDAHLGTRLIDDPLTSDRNILAVKIEIQTDSGENLKFEFQNIEQSKNFFNEFDLENLHEVNN